MQHLDKFNIINFDIPIHSNRAIRQTEYLKKIAEQHTLIFPISFYENDNYLKSKIDKEQLYFAFTEPHSDSMDIIMDYYEKAFLNLVRQICNIIFIKIDECENQGKNISFSNEDPVQWFLSNNTVPKSIQETYLVQYSINRFLIELAFKEACAVIFDNQFDHSMMFLPIYKEHLIKKYYNSQNTTYNANVKRLKEIEIKNTISLLSQSINIS